MICLKLQLPGKRNVRASGSENCDWLKRVALRNGGRMLSFMFTKHMVSDQELGHNHHQTLFRGAVNLPLWDRSLPALVLAT